MSGLESQFNFVVGMEDATAAAFSSIANNFTSLGPLVSGAANALKGSLTRVETTSKGIFDSILSTSANIKAAFTNQFSETEGAELIDKYESGLLSSSGSLLQTMKSIGSFWMLPLDKQRESIDASSQLMSVYGDQLKELQSRVVPDAEALKALKEEESAIRSKRVQIGLLSGAMLGASVAQKALKGAATLGGLAFDSLFKLISPLVDVFNTIFGPALDYVTSILSAELEPAMQAMLNLAHDLAPSITALAKPLSEMFIQLAIALSDKLLQGPDAPILVLMSSLADLALALIPLVVALVPPLIDVAVAVIQVMASGLVDLANFVIPVLVDNVDVLVPVLYSLVGVFVALKVASVAAAAIGLIASPVGLVVGAIAGLVAGVTALVYYWDDVIQAFQDARQYVKDILGGFDLLGAAAYALVAPLVLLYEVNKAMFEFLWDSGKRLVRWIAKSWEPFSNAVVSAFDAISDGISYVGTKFSEFFTLVGSLASQVLTFFDPLVTFVDEQILPIFTRIGESVMGFFSSLWVDIKTLFSESVASLLDAVGLNPEVLSGIWEAIKAAIQVPIDAIKGFINSYLIDTLNNLITYEIDYIGSLQSVVGLGTIPRLAAGGVVGVGNSGTTAVVGEAGPEAVIPLKPQVLEKVIPEFVTNVNASLDASSIARLGKAVDSGKDDLRPLLTSVLQELKGLREYLAESLSVRDDMRLLTKA